MEMTMTMELPPTMVQEYMIPTLESVEDLPPKMTKEKVCITPLSKREPALKASREVRNTQTVQQAILIALLTTVCDVTVKQPARKSVVTQQFMRMKSLDFGNDEIIPINEYLKP